MASDFFTYPTSRTRYSSPREEPCAGFDLQTGYQCRQPSTSSFSGFCITHAPQRYWSERFAATIDERRAHARGGRCMGVAAYSGMLCGRRIRGCRFCHSHMNQIPPTIFQQDLYDYLATPSRGSELTTRSAAVKENMMAYWLVYAEYTDGERKTRERAEAAAEKARNAAKNAKEEAEKAKKATTENERTWKEQRSQQGYSGEELRRIIEEALRQFSMEQKKWEEAKAAEGARKKAEARAQKLRQEQIDREAAEEARRKKAEREEAERRRKEEEKQRKANLATREKRMAEMKHLQDIVTEFCSSSIEFDKTKFSPSNRASFRAIPWPVLVNRSNVTSAEVTWLAVEKFFRTVKDLLGITEYRRLLEEARKRYHPNRWAAKGIAKTVLGEVERTQIEEAGNTVSQAINSLVTASSL